MDNVSKPAKSAISTLSKMPNEYDKLLGKYVVLLKKQPLNPYESYFVILAKSFNPFFQAKFWKSSYVKEFMKKPNTLAQELVGADEILEYLEIFDDDAIRSLLALNNMNLRRIQARSATSWITPGIATVGGLLTLTPIFQGLVTTISPFIKLLAISGLIGTIMGGGMNALVSLPRIGLVKALGDILAIAVAYRKIKID